MCESPDATGLYYLQRRYYDPQICRFINADMQLNIGTGFVGCNLYAYCMNNPVSLTDDDGHIPFFAIAIVVAAVALLVSGCSKASNSERIRSAMDLDDVKPDLLSPSMYNCYGNAIMKATTASPTGYRIGDDVETVFSAVQSDLGGEENCRRLESINSTVDNGWYMVALRCGGGDFHFIRRDEKGWYNKSGTKPGLYVTVDYVTGDMWWIRALGEDDDRNIIYTGEIIYFEVRKEWSK